MAGKFEGIYEALREDIEGGVYPYQAFLPSEHVLCERFSCARNTVRRALSALVARGYVQSIHGKGVRVLYRPSVQRSFFVGGIETFTETAARNHFKARTRVVRFEPLVADASLAAKTGFPEGTALMAIDRVRLLDGVALILDKNLFRADIVTDLTREIAEASVYAYIEGKLQLRIVTSKRRITVERATREDREFLELGDYDCLAVVTSQAFIADGTQVEYTISRHHPERFAFEDTAVRGV